jgi:hypothetical protein
VSARELVAEGMDGAQIGDALRRKRLQVISRYKSQYKSHPETDHESDAAG